MNPYRDYAEQAAPDSYEDRRKAGKVARLLIGSIITIGVLCLLFVALAKYDAALAARMV